MTQRPARTVLLLTALAGAACGTEARDIPGGPELTPPEGECAVQTAMPADEGAMHVASCSPVTYRTKPPSSGAHYDIWPVNRVYGHPVPWGFLVHALEHGVVVIAYNCPEGCATEVDAAKAMIAALPPRPGCPGPGVILTPDPTLDTRFAAAAWRRILRATCFDRMRFTDFVRRHIDRGPESIPQDCGKIDLEVTGWCPGGA